MLDMFDRSTWSWKMAAIRSMWMYCCFHGNWPTRILGLVWYQRARLEKCTWLRIQRAGRGWPANWWVLRRKGWNPVCASAISRFHPQGKGYLHTPARFCLFTQQLHLWTISVNERYTNLTFAVLLFRDTKLKTRCSFKRRNLLEWQKSPIYTQKQEYALCQFKKVMCS